MGFIKIKNKFNTYFGYIWYTLYKEVQGNKTNYKYFVLDTINTNTAFKIPCYLNQIYIPLAHFKPMNKSGWPFLPHFIRQLNEVFKTDIINSIILLISITQYWHNVF